MSPDVWREVGTLFNELVVLDELERSARLDEIGRSDPDLRHSVQALLAADARADDELARFDLGMSDIIRRTTSSREDLVDALQLSGKTVSHFRVVEHIASGGMGVVYRAEDKRLNRTVALKFPQPRHPLESGVRNRFEREARAVGALDHVNLCTVYEVGESEYGFFIAMPLYPGETLKARLVRTGRLSVEESLGIARQIVSGLACTHGAGVVHRDLKPGNLMILPDGSVKILDFGLAKMSDLSQTKSGVALGTISYMSPEQIRGSSADFRADLWSVGVILYEMLTGSRPFAGEHGASVVNAILNNEPQPPSSIRTDLPRPLQKLILTLLEKDPADRYQSAQELADDVEALRRGAEPSFRPSVRPRARRWAKKRGVYLLLLLAVALTATIAISAPKISASLNRPTKNPQAYQFYLRGLQYEQSGPAAAAESLYRRALSLDSGFALARARLAIVYAECHAGGSRDCYGKNADDPRINRLEQIRREAQTALRQDPQLADAHYAMGLYWEQREDPSRALAELERAKHGLGDDGGLHAAIGRAYRAQGRWDDAVRELKFALEKDSRDVTSVADLATTYSRLRRYEESAKTWDRYLALAPDAYPGMIIRGNVYLRWQGTVDTLVATLQRMPVEWRTRSVNTRVLVARIQHRPDEALAAVNQARRVADDPSTFQVHALLRAQIYGDMGDSMRARAYYDTARILLEDSVAAKPDDFRRRISLGLAYAGLGRTEEAKRAAEKAMEIMPPSRTVPAGTTVMKGAAEIFARIPQYQLRAIELIDQLMQMPAGREASVPLLRIDPAWNPIRDEPGFQQLLARYSSR
jgi:serine/threonine protein kinase/cytochrome c-type biogenesis protein CcmH/NrfG